MEQLAYYIYSLVCIFSINRGDRVNRTPLLVKDEKLAIAVG